MKRIGKPQIAQITQMGFGADLESADRSPMRIGNTQITQIAQMVPDRNLSGLRFGVIAVAMSLLMAVTAFASGRLSPAARDEQSRVGTESYPAAYAAPLDAGAREVTSLDSALGSSAIGRRMARRYPTGTDSSMQALLKKPHQWSVIHLPPPIARLMKGAQVFLFHSASDVTPTKGREFWRIREIVAVKGKKLYELPANLVALLEDCGVRFRREDVAAWIPVAAYMVVAGYRYPGAGTDGPPNRYAREDSIASGQAPLVPTLAISRVLADTAKTMSLRMSLLPGDIEEVRVVVQVEGETDTMFIEMERSGEESYPNTVRWRLFEKLSVPWHGMRDEETPSMGVQPSELVYLGKAEW